MAVIQKCGLDQAARINPSAIPGLRSCIAPGRNAPLATARAGLQMAIIRTIRPRPASRLCHLQTMREVAWCAKERARSANVPHVNSVMVLPPPIHPDRLSWGDNPAVGLLARGFELLAFPGSPSGLLSNLLRLQLRGQPRTSRLRASAPSSLLSLAGTVGTAAVANRHVTVEHSDRLNEINGRVGVCTNRSETRRASRY